MPSQKKASPRGPGPRWMTFAFEGTEAQLDEITGKVRQLGMEFTLREVQPAGDDR